MSENITGPGSEQATFSAAQEFGAVPEQAEQTALRINKLAPDDAAQLRSVFSAAADMARRPDGARTGSMGIADQYGSIYTRARRIEVETGRPTRALRLTAIAAASGAVGFSDYEAGILQKEGVAVTTLNDLGELSRRVRVGRERGLRPHEQAEGLNINGLLEKARHLEAKDPAAAADTRALALGFGLGAVPQEPSFGQYCLGQIDRLLVEKPAP